MRISEQVRELCAQSGLSLRDLEETAGLETGYLTRMLQGQEVPSCEILGRLSTALEVPFERLFFQEGEVVVTSKLTPRLTLDQLTQGRIDGQPLVTISVLKLTRLFGLL